MVNHGVGAGVLGGSSFSVYALRRFGSGYSPVAAVTPLSEVFSVPKPHCFRRLRCSTMAAVNNAAVSFVFYHISSSERYQYVIIG